MQEQGCHVPQRWLARWRAALMVVVIAGCRTAPPVVTSRPDARPAQTPLAAVRGLLAGQAPLAFTVDPEIATRATFCRGLQRLVRSREDALKAIDRLSAELSDEARRYPDRLARQLRSLTGCSIAPGSHADRSAATPVLFRFPLDGEIRHFVMGVRQTLDAASVVRAICGERRLYFFVRSDGRVIDVEEITTPDRVVKLIVPPQERPPEVEFEVHTIPEQATVRFRDSVQRAPVRQRVAEGIEVQVEVSAPGFETATVRGDVGPNRLMVPAGYRSPRDQRWRCTVILIPARAR